MSNEEKSIVVNRVYELAGCLFGGTDITDVARFFDDLSDEQISLLIRLTIMSGMSVCDECLARTKRACGDYCDFDDIVNNGISTLFEHACYVLSRGSVRELCSLYTVPVRSKYEGLLHILRVSDDLSSKWECLREICKCGAPLFLNQCSSDSLIQQNSFTLAQLVDCTVIDENIDYEATIRLMCEVYNTKNVENNNIIFNKLLRYIKYGSVNISADLLGKVTATLISYIDGNDDVIRATDVSEVIMNLLKCCWREGKYGDCEAILIQGVAFLSANMTSFWFEINQMLSAVGKLSDVDGNCISGILCHLSSVRSVEWLEEIIINHKTNIPVARCALRAMCDTGILNSYTDLLKSARHSVMNMSLIIALARDNPNLLLPGFDYTLSKVWSDIPPGFAGENMRRFRDEACRNGDSDYVCNDNKDIKNDEKTGVQRGKAHCPLFFELIKKALKSFFALLSLWFCCCEKELKRKDDWVNDVQSPKIECGNDNFRDIVGIEKCEHRDTISKGI